MPEKTDIDLTIVDDSGLLGLVDCNTYRPFVSPEWAYETLLKHFSDGMSERAIGVWECGDGGGEYIIRIHAGISKQQGFREKRGAIRVTAGELYLVSYDALTMAAQFEDEPFPSKHERNNRVALPLGDYRLRIIQTYDPRGIKSPMVGEPHFILEYEPGQGPPWNGVDWT